jgi:hypothetical protein
MSVLAHSDGYEIGFTMNNSTYVRHGSDVDQFEGPLQALESIGDAEVRHRLRIQIYGI